MKKSILVISLALMLVLSLFALTGCGENSNNSGNAPQTQQSKGNNDVFEAIKKFLFLSGNDHKCGVFSLKFLQKRFFC